MSEKSLYEELEVAPDASQEEIRRAFRKAALRWHPDRNPDSPEAEGRFKRVSEAYRILSDPGMRSAYDAGPRAPGRPSQPGGRWPFGGPFGMPTADLNDLLDEMMRSGRHVRAERTGTRSGSWNGVSPSPGKDLEQEVSITLEESLTGTVRPVRVQTGQDVPCKSCGGTRGAPGSHRRPCLSCSGTGHRMFGPAGACKQCGGHGDIPSRPCGECSGAGKTKLVREVRIQIPAGIDDGQRLRLAGMGFPAGGAGGPPGDMYVTVRIKPDGRCSRKGRDLHVVHRVSLHEAMRGATVSVPVPGRAPVSVTIPQDVKPGETSVAVRGAGVPMAATGSRGDLYVTFQVDLPRIRTARAAKLLHELMDELERPDR